MTADGAVRILAVRPANAVDSSGAPLTATSDDLTGDWVFPKGEWRPLIEGSVQAAANRITNEVVGLRGELLGALPVFNYDASTGAGGGSATAAAAAAGSAGSGGGPKTIRIQAFIFRATQQLPEYPGKNRVHKWFGIDQIQRLMHRSEYLAVFRSAVIELAATGTITHNTARDAIKSLTPVLAAPPGTVAPTSAAAITPILTTADAPQSPPPPQS